MIPGQIGNYRVVFEDSMVGRCIISPVVCEHRLLVDVASKLGQNYPDYRVYSDASETQDQYLVAGVLIRTSRVHKTTLEDHEVERIEFISESPAGIELLALANGLPPIPKTSFVPMSSQ